MMEKKKLLKVGLKYKKKKIFFEVEKVEGWKKGIGLMFSKKNTAKALLFEFKKPEKIALHSLFVFFDFVAVWLNSKNEVIEIKKVKPFQFHISPNKKFRKIVEIPINSNYKGIIKKFVGEEKFK